MTKSPIILLIAALALLLAGCYTQFGPTVESRTEEQTYYDAGQDSTLVDSTAQSDDYAGGYEQNRDRLYYDYYGPEVGMYAPWYTPFAFGLGWHSWYDSYYYNPWYYHPSWYPGHHYGSRPTYGGPVNRYYQPRTAVGRTRTGMNASTGRGSYDAGSFGPTAPRAGSITLPTARAAGTSRPSTPSVAPSSAPRSGAASRGNSAGASSGGRSGNTRSGNSRGASSSSAPPPSSSGRSGGESHYTPPPSPPPSAPPPSSSGTTGSRGGESGGSSAPAGNGGSSRGGSRR